LRSLTKEQLPVKEKEKEGQDEPTRNFTRTEGVWEGTVETKEQKEK
jgi:hypothetical protein